MPTIVNDLTASGTELSGFAAITVNALSTVTVRHMYRWVVFVENEIVMASSKIVVIVPPELKATAMSLCFRVFLTV